MIRKALRYESVSVNCQVLNAFSVMSRCYKKLIIKALKRARIKLKIVSRDYLLHPPSTAIVAAHQQNAKIGKNDDKTDKPEKKEKKIKEMSESRVKKFQKLFGQQVSADEGSKLVDYFSCALVADILLQGHLYISENYFSFYSNVFGYVTKLVIPIISVTSITREKTAKFFPNAIALQLSDGKHVFGSFLSRETAYQLMSSIHGKIVLSIEPAEDIEVEADNDDIDGVMIQDVDVSSLEDSSSISGSESPAQYKLPSLIDAPSQAHSVEASASEVAPPVIAKIILNDIPISASQHEPMPKAVNFNVKLMSECKLLFVGIFLTILLAFFSVLLLLKINAIEKHNQPSTEFDFDNKIFTIDDAESILNKNLLIVQSVRKKLEDLQDLLQSSFDKFPSLDDKQEL